MVALASKSRFLELFTPKLITVLREGYRLNDLRADAVAGLTVAIVALPLSMAIAIASGVTPDRGLYAAIFGGVIVSALGGSRFQVGGPAGAFIVLVAATAAAYGLDGLLLATMMSGVFLLVGGFLGLGTFIKYIPYPVTVGFTAGIAVIIFASQIKDLFGLTLHEPEPGELIEKIQVIGPAMPSTNIASVVLAAITILIIVAVRKFRPHWPGLLIAIAFAAVAAWALNLPVSTIGTQFGGIPQSIPAPQLPALSIDKALLVLPAALSFTLLGSIESLLSAVVADSMTGRRHRSNCELVAQGVANIVAGAFGGICVTGTIARTATNIRSGARSPIAGMLHSMFLLAFMLIAAPLASFIPLAALAGLLATVAWNMAERHAVRTLLRASRGDAAVLLVTFFLTIFQDLMIGIASGFILSTLLFLHRMTNAVTVERRLPVIDDDVPDSAVLALRTPYDTHIATDPEVMVYRITGAFFFGAAANVGAALDSIGESPKAFVVDFSEVPNIDSTAASTIRGFVGKSRSAGALVFLSGVSPAIKRSLASHGVESPTVTFERNIGEAIAAAHHVIHDPTPKCDTVRAEPAAV
jgi:SulP family sulfate permease